jgi:hypothetical protein
MRFSIIVIAAFSLFAFGCASPEAGRTRGGGPGADPGNRGTMLRVHEGAKPFENTPKKIPTKHPPLEPASQADQLSRK